jgi:hypothetical protein
MVMVNDLEHRPRRACFALSAYPCDIAPTSGACEHRSPERLRQGEIAGRACPTLLEPPVDGFEGLMQLLCRRAAKIPRPESTAM